MSKEPEAECQGTEGASRKCSASIEQIIWKTVQPSVMTVLRRTQPEDGSIPRSRDSAIMDSDIPNSTYTLIMVYAIMMDCAVMETIYHYNKYGAITEWAIIKTIMTFYKISHNRMSHYTLSYNGMSNSRLP